MFVLAPGTWLETREAALNTQLHALVVADVEMQKGALFPRAPVATEERSLADQIEGAGQRLAGALLAREHDRNLLGHARADLVKEGTIQVATAVEVFVDRVRVELEHVIDQLGAELIAGTQRGILVTHFFYIRSLDTRTVMLTGLTRDGTFLIENGKITKSLKNFRWNESPLFMLNKIEDIGRAEPTAAGQVMPSLRVKDFNFTSLSDAV